MYYTWYIVNRIIRWWLVILSLCVCDSLAEVKEQALKDEHGSGAAQDSERLTRKQTEHSTSQRRPDKTLQHTLHTDTNTDVKRKNTAKGVHWSHVCGKALKQQLTSDSSPYETTSAYSDKRLFPTQTSGDLLRKHLLITSNYYT